MGSQAQLDSGDSGRVAQVSAGMLFNVKCLSTTCLLLDINTCIATLECQHHHTVVVYIAVYIPVKVTRYTCKSRVKAETGCSIACSYVHSHEPHQAQTTQPSYNVASCMTDTKDELFPILTRLIIQQWLYHFSVGMIDFSLTQYGHVIASVLSPCMPSPPMTLDFVHELPYAIS